MKPTTEQSDFASPGAFARALGKAIADLEPARPDATVMYLASFETPLGSLLAGATDAGLAVLEFTGPDRLGEQLRRLGRRQKRAFVSGTTAASEQAGHELEGYFSGSLRCFNVPLAPVGTAFQLASWQVLRSIPYARTLSYGAQALQLGRPRAVRAVAQANGANPISIIVPCHRVIGADGTLTGYGGGLWRKRWLLGHESGTSTVTS